MDATIDRFRRKAVTDLATDPRRRDDPEFGAADRRRLAVIAAEHAQIDLLLDSEQVANLLGISRRTLESWRTRGRGPAYIRVGGRKGGGVCRYRRADVDAWITAQREVAEQA